MGELSERYVRVDLSKGLFVGGGGWGSKSMYHVLLYIPFPISR